MARRLRLHASLPSKPALAAHATFAPQLMWSPGLSAVLRGVQDAALAALGGAGSGCSRDAFLRVRAGGRGAAPWRRRAPPPLARAAWAARLRLCASRRAGRRRPSAPAARPRRAPASLPRRLPRARRGPAPRTLDPAAP
jgi:hypothetical protein